MNLICPHCQQTVTVGDDQAGQTTTCPECGGPFTVPSPEVAPPDIGAAVNESSAPAGAESVSTPESSTTSPTSEPASSSTSPVLDFGPSPTSEPESKPSTPTAPYQMRFVVRLEPRVVWWVPMVSIFMMFFLMFFTWVTTSASGEYAFSQSGFAVAFGVADLPEGEDVSAAPFLILYFIVVLLGLIVSLLQIGERYILPKTTLTLPPQVKEVLKYRSLVFGGLTLLPFLFLGLQMLIGFPAESRHLSGVDEAVQQLYHSALHRTWAVTWSAAFTVIGVLGSLAEFWLERRVGRPLPKIEVSW